MARKNRIKTADDVAPFQDEDFLPGPSEFERADQSVVSGSDDDAVVAGHGRSLTNSAAPSQLVEKGPGGRMTVRRTGPASQFGNSECPSPVVRALPPEGRGDGIRMAVSNQNPSVTIT